MARKDWKKRQEEQNKKGNKRLILSGENGEIQKKYKTRDEGCNVDKHIRRKDGRRAGKQIMKMGRE